MENISVSVIVPIYNAEKYIEHCVKSILEQSFKNFELILVDDGSKDNSLAICENLAKTDDRIVVIHQENSGSSAAKNAGLKVARGNYVEFCDADDTVDAEYIDCLYKGANDYSADVCIGNVAFVEVCNESVLSRRTVDVEKGFYNLQDFLSFYPRYMPNAVIGAPWNKLYKRSIIVDNNLFFNTKMKNNEDTHFNYEYLANCKTVYVSDLPHYNYFNRIDSTSASKGYIENLFDVYVITYNKAIDFLHKTNTYNENIGFQNNYFSGLIIGALNNIINTKNGLTKKEKIEKIKLICNHKDVQSAIKNVKFNDIKKQVALGLIKWKKARILFFMISLRK